MLTLADKEKFITSIISGKIQCVIGDIVYIVDAPSISLRFKAESYIDALRRAHRFDGYLTDRQVKTILAQNDLWDDTKEALYKQLEKHIDDLKVELYKTMFQDEKHALVRKNLEAAKKKYNELFNTKHMFDCLTFEGYLLSAKFQFLIMNSIFDSSGNRLEIDDFYLLEQIIGAVFASKPNAEQLRELARTEPWRNMWSIAKETTFCGNICDWTDDQKNLAIYSSMYDSVYSHPECPSNDVIDDDDMLDGWLVEIRRKNEKSKMDSQIEKVVGKGASDGQELFIPTKNKEQAKKIDGMNDLEAKMVKKQRAALINTKGTVPEESLPDKRTELNRLATEQFKQKQKG